MRAGFGFRTDAAGRAVAGAGELGSAARQLFTGGSQFLSSLGTDAGSDYLRSRLDSNNPVLEEQISALREDTGRLFSEELNPAITSRASDSAIDKLSDCVSVVGPPRIEDRSANTPSSDRLPRCNTSSSDGNAPSPVDAEFNVFVATDSATASLDATSAERSAVAA